MKKFALFSHASIAASVVALAACAGGGGGGSGGGGINPPFSFATNIPSTGGASTASSPPSPIASPGTTPFAAGTEFPLTEDVRGYYLQTSPPPNTVSGIDQDLQVANGGATVTVRSNGYELKVPALNIDVVLPGDGSTLNTGLTKVTLGLELRNYIVRGIWAYEVNNINDPNIYAVADIAPFVSGYRTPAGSVPYIGTATYTAVGGVEGIVNVTTPNGYNSASLKGDVSLTANFSTDQLTGSFTNIKASDKNNAVTNWNDVTITGTVGPCCQPENQILGQTAASSAPSTPFALKSNAAGSMSGWLFGPGGEQVGALWSLGNSNSDLNGAAFGTIVADRTGGTAPANARAAALIGSLPRPEATTTGTANIGTPIAAAQDTVSNPTMTALPGGQNFIGTGAIFPPSIFSPVYPLRVTALQFTAGGVSAVASSTGARMVIHPQQGSPYIISYALQIPSLGVDSSSQISQSGIFATPFSPAFSGVATFGLSYVEFGAWTKASLAAPNPLNTGYFAFGYETPAAAVPASGSAIYSDVSGVQGTVFLQSGSTVSEAVINGDVSLTANFGAGTINGSFTNMNVFKGDTSAPWNDVSVSTSIAAGTNAFSGNTAVTSNPGGTYALKNAATGTIDGELYGPNAENLGAVWTLSNGDGTGAAVGVVGATKH